MRPFTSSDGKPEDRYFADGLAAEVRDALAGVPDLEVAAQPLADASSLGSYDAQRWGKTVGVASVLDANVTRSERGALRLQARLTDTASGAALWTGSYEREAGDVVCLAEMRWPAKWCTSWSGACRAWTGNLASA